MTKTGAGTSFRFQAEVPHQLCPWAASAGNWYGCSEHLTYQRENHLAKGMGAAIGKSSENVTVVKECLPYFMKVSSMGDVHCFQCCSAALIQRCICYRRFEMGRSLFCRHPPLWCSDLKDHPEESSRRRAKKGTKKGQAKGGPRLHQIQISASPRDIASMLAQSLAMVRIVLSDFQYP